MKKNILLTAALILAAVVSHLPARAAARTVTIFSGVSAASGTYTDPQGNAAERTAGAQFIRFQVCGAGFSGTVTAKQGALSTSTVAVEALTISGLTGCSATYYIKLNPAVWTDFDYTRSAGTLTVYLELQ